MTAPSIEIGQAIAAARQRRGWTQAELARRLGDRDRNTISAWERGLGIGLANLLEVVSQMPDVGGETIKLIRRAQRAHLAQRRQQP